MLWNCYISAVLEESCCRILGLLFCVLSNKNKSSSSSSSQPFLSGFIICKPLHKTTGRIQTDRADFLSSWWLEISWLVLSSCLMKKTCPFYLYFSLKVHSLKIQAQIFMVQHFKVTKICSIIALLTILKLILTLPLTAQSVTKRNSWIVLRITQRPIAQFVLSLCRCFQSHFNDSSFVAFSRARAERVMYPLAVGQDVDQKALFSS